MEDKIIIVADRSGSMSEAGKSSIELNAIRAARAWCRRQGLLAEVYAWGETVEPRFTPCSGSAQADALEQFCRELPPRSSILLLSDGAFRDSQNAMRIREAAENSYLIPVAVGADYDRQNLREISGCLESDAGIYEASEVLDALRCLSFRRAMEANGCG